MSVRIYSSPGNITFPRPTVLRQYVPTRVSRQVRYTRSLSVPLGLDKAFTYTSFETNSRDFANSLLEASRRRGYTNPALECKRDYFINTPLETKHRELTYPLSESKRWDFTKDYSEKTQRHMTKNHLENNRRDLTKNHLESNRRDLSTNHLESNRRDLTKNHLENNRRDLVKNHLENSRRDLANGYLDNKRNSTSLENKRWTLSETPRGIRWWNNEKQLCSPDDLLEIILEPTGQYELPTDPCNEVYPGIILSDGPTALCTSMLKRMCVSHVLNAAQGKERPGQVNTTPSFYSYSRIRFLGIEAFDHIAFRLYPYFDEAADFIQEALDSGGKVLVHCRAGISRSATLVCAFLMLKRHLSAQEAIRTVRKKRPIIPNDGFLQQLCDLNERLNKKTKGP